MNHPILNTHKQTHRDHDIVLIAIMNVNKDMIKPLNTLGLKELHFVNNLRVYACLINHSFNHICVSYGYIDLEYSLAKLNIH